MSLNNTINVFNEQVQIVAFETVDQSVKKFNEASNGALILGTGDTLGDYLEESSYALISDFIQDRDAYGTGTNTPVTLDQILDRSVKKDFQTKPLKYTLEQFKRLQQSPETAGLIAGENYANQIMQYQLNNSIGALSAAISNTTDFVTDIAGATASLTSLIQAAGKMGDRQQQIGAWLMHSKVFTDLQVEAATNASRLYTIGNINIMQDGLGRVYVVTDSPELVDGARYRTLGLCQGAAILQTSALDSLMAPNATDENMGYTWKGESSYTIGLKGFAWSAANGGKSPSTAELSTAANWSKYVTADKDTAGVMLITD